MTKFETNKTYQTPSMCDHDCVFKFQILKRTAKTVTLKWLNEIHTRRIKIDAEGREYVYPLGTHSMAPIIDATDLEPESKPAPEPVDEKEKYKFYYEAYCL